MSEKEKYIALADMMTESQLSQIINIILVNLADIRSAEDREIAECRRIFEECVDADNRGDVYK